MRPLARPAGPRSLARPAGPRSLARPDGAHARVTEVELFFDLVYVFAVTQLSHRLLADPTWAEAGRTAVLFAMVWLAWAYTAWVTNWLDPARIPVRVLLLLLVPGSLVLSAGIADAYGERGLWVGGAYAAMQLFRSAFAVVALRGHHLEANFRRILAWCALSSVFAVWGGVAHGDARIALWAGSVAVDLLGGLTGFRTPGLGRSTTADWTIDAGHFAERCSAFVLIALGESVVSTGTAISDRRLDAGGVVGFAEAVAAVVLLWWLYFDRTARAAAEEVGRSGDPGRFARSAYHLVHPVIVAGIVITAAADERVLEAPTEHAAGATGWLVLGGVATYVLGLALFRAAVWRRVPPAYAGAVAVLLLLLLVAPHVPGIAVGPMVLVVLLGVLAADRGAG